MSKRKMGFTQRRDIVLAVILIIIVTFFVSSRQAEGIALQIDEEGMTLTGPEAASFTVEVKFTDILSISETDSLDVGTNLTGVCTDQCWYGTWRNDAFGEYTLCALPSVEQYIVLETPDGILVWNCENAGTTQGLYTALAELVENGPREG